MITGIPYFGEKTQEITNSILNTNEDIIYEKEYDSLYDLILDNIDKHIIVVIDNKWLTWLNDIVFNYRDKECYIPYYTYDIYWLDDKKYNSNNKGHLILNDNKLGIRYNYKYEKYNININDLSLQCINIDKLEKFVVRAKYWINDTNLNIDKLYKLYINSCYKDDDFTFNKHSGGYHYIEKSPKQFKNKEKYYREYLDINTYAYDNEYERDYRDVRNYTYNEVILKHGMLDTIDLYRERRLRFESYLYCCLREHLLNNLSFKNGIYKTGDNIKLIIKKYWLDNIDKPDKTWIK